MPLMSAQLTTMDHASSKSTFKTAQTQPLTISASTGTTTTTLANCMK